MSVRTVDIVEAQASLPELVSLVTAGVEVVLTRDSTPVACLVPMESPPAERVPGLHPGAITTSSDFDQPLPDCPLPAVHCPLLPPRSHSP
jgi:antitoxin (DNA-binding transcriptional repressor) of toxin-antitoxin stability system